MIGKTQFDEAKANKEAKGERIEKQSKIQGMEDLVTEKYDLIKQEVAPLNIKIESEQMVPLVSHKDDDGFRCHGFPLFSSRQFFLDNQLLHFQTTQGVHENTHPLLSNRMLSPITALPFVAQTNDFRVSGSSILRPTFSHFSESLGPKSQPLNVIVHMAPTFVIASMSPSFVSSSMLLVATSIVSSLFSQACCKASPPR